MILSCIANFEEVSHIAIMLLLLTLNTLCLTKDFSLSSVHKRKRNNGNKARQIYIAFCHC